MADKRFSVMIQVIFLSVSIIALAISCIYLDLKEYAGSHGADDSKTEAVITALPGQGLGEISKQLHEAHIIEKPLKFRCIARFKGYDKQVKVGEYRLSSAMSPEKILQLLVAGKVILYKFTIPEGYNIKQIAEVVSSTELATESSFIKAATNANLVHQHGIKAETFEGYLFPDTYYFPKNTPPEKIISTMFQRFQSMFMEEWNPRAAEIGFTIHEVITMASIIEKETGVPVERPIISSVFHNRLKRHMRLESDPTVIYGIKNYDGNITRKDLRHPTPYNTYLIKSLPPGPIANPGIASIRAALFPVDTNYLYFVSKKNGTHYFSRSFKEHNQAVGKYQLGK